MAPGVGRVLELTEFALLGLAVCVGILHVEFKEFGDLLQPGVACQSHDEAHIGALAVVQDALAAKA